MSWYQKDKTDLDFTEARDSEWQWHQLGHMQTIGTSLQTDNHATTPPLSFLQAGCPSCRPTNSVKALKATCFYPLNDAKRKRKKAVGETGPHFVTNKHPVHQIRRASHIIYSTHTLVQSASYLLYACSLFSFGLHSRGLGLGLIDSTLTTLTAVVFVLLAFFGE